MHNWFAIHKSHSYTGDSRVYSLSSLSIICVAFYFSLPLGYRISCVYCFLLSLVMTSAKLEAMHAYIYIYI